jgi:hypothetical protein
MKKDQMKMTREEAIERLKNVAFPREKFLDALEALGLIKFDKSEKELHFIIGRARLYTRGTFGSQAMFINYLKDHGYKIERI